MWTDRYTPLRIVFRGTLLTLLIVIGTIPVVLCINRVGNSIRVGNRQLDEFMLRIWTLAMCRIFSVRVRVKGVIEPAPTLIVSNHISWLDIIALHTAAPMGFVSKAEVATWPLVGTLARKSNTVFHERGKHDSSSNVTAAMTKRLKDGQRVAIFPEGGIKPGDHVKVFHARLFAAAVEVACPVQPVMIRYVRNGRRDPDMTFMANERFVGNIFRLLGRPACVCDIRFLEAVQAQGRPRRELAESAQAAVSAVFEEQL